MADSELEQLRRRVAELEREQKKAEDRLAVHVRVMLRLGRVKTGLDKVIKRIKTEGAGRGYAVDKLLTDLEGIRATARMAEEDDRRSSTAAT